MAINGVGRPTKAQAEERKKLNAWMDTIATYEREFKPWEGRVQRILKRYRDDRRESAGENTLSRFNVLWANVQTLVPATFSRIPQPDVARRFRDNDPVGRVASLILERALEYEVQHYPDYKATMKQAVADRFLGGRGTAWARYEPKFRAMQQALPPDGSQVSEDVDATEEEEIDYECAPVDYVAWKDFGHSVGRTWEEVTKVWRNVYMTRDACIERFGEEAGKRIPLDATPDEAQRDAGTDKADYQRAHVIEGWDKEKKEAVWISKSLKEIVDTKPDPLHLEGFFPCPKPLYATLTNESLIPVPDFSLYQDQARELDTLSDRIDGLVKALQVKGTYDASVPELARIFTEGTNTQLIPVKNWAAFVEKNGLQGAISLVDLKPIADALKTAYEAFFQIKAKIDELTGLSDIIRGITDPNETLGAQELKGQYASLRLKDYQQQVAQFATDVLRLKAQIICDKFAPETIKQISSAEQLSQEDQALIPQALQLLLGERANNPDDTGYHPNPTRYFRIEVAADTLVELDEQQEKKNAVEFVTAIGTFFKEVAPIVASAPETVPLVGALLKFAVSRFKVGKTIEGVIDEAMEKAKQAAMQPKEPPPNPEMEKIKIEAARLERDSALENRKLDFEERKHADEVALKMRELSKPEAVESVNPEREQAEIGKIYAEIDKTLADAEKARKEAELAPQKAEAEIAATQAGAEKTQAEGAAIKAPVEEAKERENIAASLQEVMQAVESLKQEKEASEARKLTKAERLRGPSGNLIAVRKHFADGTSEDVAVH